MADFVTYIRPDGIKQVALKGSPKEKALISIGAKPVTQSPSSSSSQSSSSQARSSSSQASQPMALDPRFVESVTLLPPLPPQSSSSVVGMTPYTRQQEPAKDNFVGMSRAGIPPLDQRDAVYEPESGSSMSFAKAFGLPKDPQSLETTWGDQNFRPSTSYPHTGQDNSRVAIPPPSTPKTNVQPSPAQRTVATTAAPATPTNTNVPTKQTVATKNTVNPPEQNAIPFRYEPPEAPVDGTKDAVAGDRGSMPNDVKNYAGPNEEMASVAPQATGVEPQRWQTVYNWLMGRKPTITPAQDFYLHGLPGLGAISEQESRQRAELEQRALQQQAALAQKAQAANAKTKQGLTMAEVRDKQWYLNQYNELLKEWKAGHYTGNDETENEFFDRVDAMRNLLVNKYKMDPRELRYPVVNPGGFQQGANKLVSEPLNKLRHLDDWMGKIYQRAMEDPNWLNDPEARTEFDKLGEYVLLQRARSKGAIADAEKIRAQVEMMNPAVRNAYDNVFAMFFGDNRGVMALAQKYKLSESSAKTLENIKNMLDPKDMPSDPNDAKWTEWRDKMGKMLTDKKENVHLMNAVGELYNAMNNPGENVPVNLSAAASAAKNGIEAFQQYVLQDAPVNMGLIWNIALSERDEAEHELSDWSNKMGKRYGWKYHTNYKPTRDFGNWLSDWQKSYGTENEFISSGEPVTAGQSPAHLITVGRYNQMWNGANSR